METHIKMNRNIPEKQELQNRSFAGCVNLLLPPECGNNVTKSGTAFTRFNRCHKSSALTN